MSVNSWPFPLSTSSITKKTINHFFLSLKKIFCCLVSHVVPCNKCTRIKYYGMLRTSTRRMHLYKNVHLHLCGLCSQNKIDNKDTQVILNFYCLLMTTKEMRGIILVCQRISTRSETMSLSCFICGHVQMF